MTDMTQAMPAGTSTGEKVQDAASTLARQAGGEVKAVSKDVRAHGQQLVSTSMDQLRGQAAEQATRLTEGLNDATQQLRKLASGDPQPGMVSDLVQQLADVTQRAADRMSEGGLDGAMSDLRRVARNRTGLFLLGALGAGVVVGRVLRATDTHSIVESAKEAFTGDDGQSDATGLGANVPPSGVGIASTTRPTASVAAPVGMTAPVGVGPSVAEGGL